MGKKLQLSSSNMVFLELPTRGWQEDQTCHQPSNLPEQVMTFTWATTEETDTQTKTLISQIHTLKLSTISVSLNMESTICQLKLMKQEESLDRIS